MTEIIAQTAPVHFVQTELSFFEKDTCQMRLSPPGRATVSHYGDGRGRIEVLRADETGEEIGSKRVDFATKDVRSIELTTEARRYDYEPAPVSATSNLKRDEVRRRLGLPMRRGWGDDGFRPVSSSLTFLLIASLLLGWAAFASIGGPDWPKPYWWLWLVLVGLLFWLGYRYLPMARTEFSYSHDWMYLIVYRMMDGDSHVAGSIYIDKPGAEKALTNHVNAWESAKHPPKESTGTSADFL